jgi:hypothetical protein
MDEIVGRVAGAAGIDADTARQAIVAILAFLRKEGPAAEVDQLFAAIPGAAVAADVPAPGGGGLMGMLGGMGGGGLMALAGQLTSLGLGMGEMQNVGRELFAYGREKAGEDTMGAIVGAVPGLAQFV